MNKFFLWLFLAAAGTGARAQGTSVAQKPLKETVVLKEQAFDFGKIPQGRPVIHVFEVMNGSADTLKLENVVASCGCTTPVWKKEPVVPGGNTAINVGYNAASEGPFEKLVTIFYNGGQTKSLTIKGNVYKGPVTSAPQNTSIELLKQTNQ